MTDTTQAALSPESFDVLDWLGGVNYPKKKTEIFRDGQNLMEMAELIQFVRDNRERAEVLSQKKNLLGMSTMSIGDDEDEDNEGKRLLALVEEAQEKADAILEGLRGTGTTFVVEGISPGEREVLAKKVARSLKSLKEDRYDGDELVESAHAGGEGHPEYNGRLALQYATKCIKGIIGADGKTVVPVKFSLKDVEEMREKLLSPEFNRLINTVFEVNYVAYEIDSKVTVDFS